MPHITTMIMVQNVQMTSPQKKKNVSKTKLLNLVPRDNMKLMIQITPAIGIVTEITSSDDTAVNILWTSLSASVNTENSGFVEIE